MRKRPVLSAVLAIGVLATAGLVNSLGRAMTEDIQPSYPIRAAFYSAWYPEAWRDASGNLGTNYKPTLGYYDSSDRSVIDAHIAAMLRGGIDAGIAMWLGRGTNTDDRVPALLAGAADTPFRWSLYYQPEAGGDPSSSAITADLQYIRDRYGNDPSYLRIDGKFVVFVRASSTDDCDMASRWDRANTVGAFLVLKVFDGFASCSSQPDGWHQYAPGAAESNVAPFSFSISPGYWPKGEPDPRLSRSLDRWRKNVGAMIDSGARFQLISSFNHWEDGSAIESGTRWGDDYLDVLRGADSAPSPSSPQPDPRSSNGDPVIAAAGDIACDPNSGSFNGGAGTRDNCRQMATSNLLVGSDLAGVLLLGDNQYENGSLSKFRASFAPSWGRVKSLIHPAVGNHEYLTSGAAGYFNYFGAAAGDPSKGYYSFDIGAWHLIAINSNCSAVGGCGSGSPQERWLKADLAAHPAACTLAYWHHPRFSSGQHGNFGAQDAIWRDLYAAGAEIVLSGHDHDYERFAPQDPSANPDANGVRQFVVGTGGKNHYGFNSTKPNSQVRNDSTYGVLRLTLHPASYDWRFVPESGKSFTDSGSTACH